MFEMFGCISLATIKILAAFCAVAVSAFSPISLSLSASFWAAVASAANSSAVFIPLLLLCFIIICILFFFFFYFLSFLHNPCILQQGYMYSRNQGINRRPLLRHPFQHHSSRLPF